MPAEFMHVELYAARGLRGKPSARAVLAEAARLGGYHPHVADAKTPQIVFGRPLSEVLETHDARIRNATDRGRRRLPATFPSLLGVVASVPIEPRDMVNPKVRAAVQDWLGRTINFLRCEFGDALLSVATHSDERFFHLHGYCVPPVDAVTGALSVESIWRPAAVQGEVRRADAEAQRIRNEAPALPEGQVEQGKEETDKKKGLRARQRDAYRAEAAAFLDRYHAALSGSPLKLLRIDSARPRQRRPDYLAQQRRREEEARHEAERKAALDWREHEIDLRERELEGRLLALEDRVANFGTEIERRVADHRTAVEQESAQRIERIKRTAAERIVQERGARLTVEEELSRARVEIARLRQALDDAETASYSAPRPF